MKTESGSIRISKPDRYEPPEIQVHPVASTERCCGSLPSSKMKLASAPPKATKHESVAM
jgi:hypothetical protein